MRWQADLVGYAVHNPVIDPVGGSVYVTDGWGPASYLALKFRRLDLASGREVATVRLGNLVNCVSFGAGAADLIAATDKKLYRLDRMTLGKLGQWDRKVPRYSKTMVARGDRVALASVIRPTIGFVDLPTGEVSLRRGGSMTRLLDDSSRPLAISGGGGVSRLDLPAATVSPLLETPPVRSGAISASGKDLWLTLGVPILVETLSHGARVGPAPLSNELRRYGLEEPGRLDTFEAPVAVQTVAAGPAALWLSNGPRPPDERQYILAVPEPVGAEPARMWTAPERHIVISMAPSLGIALTLTLHSDAAPDRLTCFDLRF